MRLIDKIDNVEVSSAKRPCFIPVHWQNGERSALSPLSENLKAAILAVVAVMFLPQVSDRLEHLAPR